MNRMTRLSGPGSPARSRISSGCVLALLLLVPVSGLAQAASGTDQENAQAQPQRLFELSSQCIACHSGLLTPSGEDVSIGFDWRASMMANAALDPYWQATVRREVLDHPGASEEIQAECSTCHMPMSSYEARAVGASGSVFSHLPVAGTVGRAGPATRADQLAADGVSCTTCHQIRDAGVGTEESFVGGFVVDETSPPGNRELFGPFQVDSGRTRIMHSASGFRATEASHIQRSELCATCHTLITHARNDEDEVVGELPEQVPYLEWLHSDFRDEKSCQDCHMPVVQDSVAVTGVLGQPRAGVNRHVFRGGNFFVLRMLNRHAAELGVKALPQELDASIRRTLDHLQTSAAELEVEEVVLADGTLRVEVAVANLAGHKLPTAYPSRRAWLHVTVRDRDGTVIFESGALNPGAWIEGNDNDADPSRYEPHHRQITSPEDVQVYEAVMVDWRGDVTTGVTTGIRYVKDNRILPRGFDKSAAGEDIAVQGKAASDQDFTGGSDRVRYAVDVGDARGPFRVQAELWYQPIGYRWAQNLRQQQAAEIDRFVSYYQSMSRESAVILGRAAATVP